MEKKLTNLISDLEKELERLGYTAKTRKNYCGVWSLLKKYAVMNSVEFFTDELGIGFLDDVYGIANPISVKLRQSECNKVRAIRRVSEFQKYGTIITSSREIRVPHVSFNLFHVQLSKFLDYCRGDKVYADSVVLNYGRFVELFLGFLEKQDIRSFSAIDIALIDVYTATLSNYTRGTITDHLCALRVFLGYLFENDLHPHDLRKKIQLPSQRKLSTIPAIWKREDVLRLLNAVDRANPIGKRNYAILLMVTRLGIRACDVRELKLCDFKWQDNRLEFTQMKTNKPISLPLPRDVGWAVIDYLKDGRPIVDSPYIFLKHIPPFDHFTNSIFSYDIIHRYMLIAKISTNMGSNRTGLHALRHSLALSLLEKHTPLPVISKILGHASTNSTSAYLKVDVPMLRQCALDFEEV